MPLKGQAKTNYQRNYMRKRRLLDPAVRPAEADRYIRNDVMLRSIHKGGDRIISEHPAYIDADGGVVYE